MKSLTQVIESNPIHKPALISREKAHSKLARITDAVGNFDRAIEFGAAPQDIASTIHSHSTFAEALQEAAMLAAQMCSLCAS